MYNKLFGKILDSSIWLEPTSTRICWITLLAAMDEDGYAHFSAIENLAGRARVTVEEAKAAVECFLAPDPNSSNPANEGRRVERVPGGFLILNAEEHRKMYKRLLQREDTRKRVALHRQRKNYGVSTGNNGGKRELLADAEEVYENYPRKVAKKAAIAKIAAAIHEFGLEKVLEATKTYAQAWLGATDLQYCPHPATWYGGHRFNDDPATWARNDGKKLPESREIHEELEIPKL